MNLVKRYEWEDALIDAQTQGHISNGALLVALKLARAINWCPKDGRPAGLYWKNEEALKAVGASRTTYYEHRKALFDAGFFIEVKGNLIPQVPQSAVGTDESALGTSQSAVRTEKSAGRNPLSEDTYSDDVSSEDYSSVREGPVPNPSLSNTVEAESMKGHIYFLNSEGVTRLEDSSSPKSTGAAPAPKARKDWKEVMTDEEAQEYENASAKRRRSIETKCRSRAFQQYREGVS